MSENLRPVHESDLRRDEYSDRWSKNLITGAQGATSGFNLGVAEYTSESFGPSQVHDDQEAVYVVDGEGEIRLGKKVYPVCPGSAVYIPRGTPHATRRTTEKPVKVVYAHGAV
ncbi:MAG TPA: cupin domain-containing protein [archaeon]|nr:cupin domain-containing protein [archaeon]